MGRFFARPTLSSLQFTGERYTSSAPEQTEAEHYHRYLFVRDLVKDKDVLDIACGEGYGAALLMQTAKSVVGADINADAVQNASQNYRGVSFLVSTAECLPFADASFDVLTSFETFEHFANQRHFVAEAQRVLRPGGILVVSTPNSEVYSALFVNEFHVSELREADFYSIINERFSYVLKYRQRPMMGSLIALDSSAESAPNLSLFEKRGNHFEQSSSLERAPYLIAVASDSNINLDVLSAYCSNRDPHAESEHIKSIFRTEEGRLHGLLDVAERKQIILTAEIDFLRRHASALLDLYQSSGRVDAGTLSQTGMNDGLSSVIEGPAGEVKSQIGSTSTPQLEEKVGDHSAAEETLAVDGGHIQAWMTREAMRYEKFQHKEGTFKKLSEELRNQLAQAAARDFAYRAAEAAFENELTLLRERLKCASERDRDFSEAELSFENEASQLREQLTRAAERDLAYGAAELAFEAELNRLRDMLAKATERDKAFQEANKRFQAESTQLQERLSELGERE